MRRVSHSVLLAFLCVAALNTILMATAGEKLAIFYPLFALTFCCFGLIGANFNSLAMEPLGKIAGTASAAPIGVISGDSAMTRPTSKATIAANTMMNARTT